MLRTVTSAYKTLVVMSMQHDCRQCEGLVKELPLLRKYTDEYHFEFKHHIFTSWSDPAKLNHPVLSRVKYSPYVYVTIENLTSDYDGKCIQVVCFEPNKPRTASSIITWLDQQRW